jgi:hypothetical protein
VSAGSPPGAQKPRVLVCTVDCWNDGVGSDTFSTLFDDYPTDRLANLYIREEVPNSAVCRRYFRISEDAVLRSVLDRRVKTGRELLGEDLAADEADVAALRDTRRRYERFRGKRRWIFLYAREIIWSLGKWKTPELDAFIRDFKPDVVVFGMEGYIHFNRINRYVVERTGARAIGYFYDDNFTYRQKPWSLGYRVYRSFQRRDLKKTAKCCNAFFAISPKTKRECDAFFGIDSILLTKPVKSADAAWRPYAPHRAIKMLYTGNLLIGRLRTIRLLGDALDRVNAGEVKVELDVYTTTVISEEEVRGLSSSIHLRGAMPQGGVLPKQRDADILLFVEDLTGPERQTARLSFSTKLTDYFHSGRCIFAIGAQDIAPIEYLQAEDAAVCATSEPEILEQIRRLVADPSLVTEYGRKALECGQRNHDERVVKRLVGETVARVAGMVDRRE